MVAIIIKVLEIKNADIIEQWYWKYTNSKWQTIAVYNIFKSFAIRKMNNQCFFAH